MGNKKQVLRCHDIILRKAFPAQSLQVDCLFRILVIRACLETSSLREILLMEEIRHSPVEAGSLSRYLKGVVYPKWCRISSINSMKVHDATCYSKNSRQLVGATTHKKLEH